MTDDERRAYEKARYRQKKRQKLCVSCGKPLDTNLVTCKACTEKVRKYERDSYKFLKDIGICPICKKVRIYEGESACPDCLSKAYARHRKRDATDEGRKLNAEKKRIRRQKLKAQGICTACEKRKAAEGATKCPTCQQKNREWSRKAYMRKTEGTIPRSERVENGLCYVCGQPLDTNGRICQKCMGKMNTAKRESNKNHPWRKSNDYLFAEKRS